MREEKFVLVIDIEKSKSYIFRNIFETVTYFLDKVSVNFHVLYRSRNLI